jgi:hypothetical protein
MKVLNISNQNTLDHYIESELRITDYENGRTNINLNSYDLDSENRIYVDSAMNIQFGTESFKELCRRFLYPENTTDKEIKAEENEKTFSLKPRGKGIYAWYLKDRVSIIIVTGKGKSLTYKNSNTGMCIAYRKINHGIWVLLSELPETVLDTKNDSMDLPF